MAMGVAEPRRSHAFRALALVALTVAGATMTVRVSEGHAVAEAWAAGTAAPGGTEGAMGAFVGGLFYHYDHGPIYSYNPATGIWSAPLSFGAAFIHEGVAAAAVNGIGQPVIVFFGAPGVEVYNVATNTWALGAPMPTPRNGAGAATVGNLIYVVGGKTCVAVGCAGPGMSSAATEVYDPVTNTWLAGPPMPVAVSDVYATASRGNFVYAMGGWDGVMDRADMQILDTSTMTWALGPPMPTARGNAAAGVCGDHLYVMGGLQITTFTYLTTVERFDFQTGVWGAAPPMLTPQAEVSVGGVSDGMGTMVITTGQAGPATTQVFTVGDCRQRPPPPRGSVACRAVAIEVVETDLTGFVGDASVELAESEAAVLATPGAMMPPAAPMDPPAAPQASASAEEAGASYFNPTLDIGVDARGVFSECSVYAASGGFGLFGHGYAHAGIADLTIRRTAPPLTVLHAEALDFETNAFGTNGGVMANMACDYAELTVAGGPTTAAVCQPAVAMSFVVPGTNTIVDVWLNEMGMPAAGFYDGSVVHVRITQPGVVQVDVYIGHTQVDLTGISGFAAPPAYIPNGPGCTLICN